uniref:Putative secreted protein n=1 Tax=Anopheles triannulatus TaxID=58253 RepID=A0A2M4B3F3_9DIPT
MFAVPRWMVVLVLLLVLRLHSHCDGFHFGSSLSFLSPRLYQNPLREIPQMTLLLQGTRWPCWHVVVSNLLTILDFKLVFPMFLWLAPSISSRTRWQPCRPVHTAL